MREERRRASSRKKEIMMVSLAGIERRHPLRNLIPS